jgi:hypothetical protein
MGAGFLHIFNRDWKTPLLIDSLRLIFRLFQGLNEDGMTEF